VPDEVADRRDAGVGAEGVEGAARQVEDLLDPEDELEPGRDQEQDGGVEDAAHQDVDEARGHGEGRLLDDAVGARDQRRGQGEPERLGGLEVDHQLELDRGLDRKLARLLAL